MAVLDSKTLVDDLRVHASENITNNQVRAARRDFSYLGYAKVPFMVPDSVKAAVANDVNSLVDTNSIRRELRCRETGSTPRRMRNVRREAIFRNGTVIREIYSAPTLLELMAEVAGEPVHLCPYEPEQCVITRLEEDGDTHGWHWDDYSFALVWVIDCPSIEDGGFVQCVPRTEWDKTNPRVNRAFVTRPIYSIELHPGDLYMMRTDTTLHRVYPIKKGQRTIVNMGYASTKNLRENITHETMDALWAEPVRLGA